MKILITPGNDHLSNSLKNKLKGHSVVYSNDTTAKNISNSDNDDYLQLIFDLFEKDSTGLPKFYPAVKRGQEVDVVFEFPLILYTN